MDARKESGRPALPTPTAPSKVRNPKSIPIAANTQPAADVFVGRALRSLRQVVAQRLKESPPAKCLRELSRAADAISSAIWAIEYEMGLRDRGER